MRIIPDCSIKPLYECKPGQIVRNLSYGREAYALAATVKDSDDRALIFLTNKGANYELVQNAKEEMVLAFSGEAVWEIDQDGPYEPPVRTLFGMPGAITCTVDGWYLNASFSQGFGHGRLLQIDIKSGEASQFRERFSNVSIFGAWRLSLHDEGTPFSEKTAVATFSWKAPGATAE
jgi:hypothetical protein